jgi:hypothetical protein
MASSATIPPLPSDPAAWDRARTAFAKSIMVDTPLASLAQDLDLPAWPVTSPDETPSAYIYLPYAQAVAALSARGLPPVQLGKLIAILEASNAFDQPFGDMMDDIAVPLVGAVDSDSPLFKNLVKLGLPEDFPLALSSLSPGTIELCRIEKVDTLGGFVAFAARLSQSVIVGGDFRDLLNALAEKDEAALARLLPLHPGKPGLHLAEAVALAASHLDAASRAAVVRNPDAVPAELRARVQRIVAYFGQEHAAMRDGVSAGLPLERLIEGAVSPELEPVVIALLLPHMPESARPVVKRSFFSRLFGRG